MSRRALKQALVQVSGVSEQTPVEPFAFMRALRSVLRMSQSQLARRSKVSRAHIARLEAGAVDVRFSTMRRLFDAMFCDLIVLPFPENLERTLSVAHAEGMPVLEPGARRVDLGTEHDG